MIAELGARSSHQTNVEDEEERAGGELGENNMVKEEKKEEDQKEKEDNWKEGEGEEKKIGESRDFQGKAGQLNFEFYKRCIWVC